jgi:L-aspartate oxidase
MQTDTLIIGCGIAGATTAIILSEDTERLITLVSRTDDLLESNSKYAQGGIVGRGDEDTSEILSQDIIKAGAGLSYSPAVEVLATEGPELLDKIIIHQAGLNFDQDQNGQLIYGLEAAHSRRRILHVGDSTGKAIMTNLLRKVEERPNIRILKSHTVVDLITFPHHSLDPLMVYQPITCHGAYVFDQITGKVESIIAQNTVLATGGLGQIFMNTTNPAGSRGDGLAMAYRAGARVINAEYVQFHPTALYEPRVTKFLISEAVRGEGGILLTPDGERFMERYAPNWKDLAPRDIVARSIYWEMLHNGYPYVLLDIGSCKPSEYLQHRFPQIYEACLKRGINITQEPIPVVPAAHYFCGGVMTDLSGQTTVSGLYAVGEVACTGVHGANRLASTSLLEGLVWGNRVAQEIQNQTPKRIVSESQIPAWDDSGLVYDGDPTLIQGDMQIIRNLMWHYVGLVRSEYRLVRAVRELRQLWLDIEEFYKKTRLSDRLIGLRNSVQAALIIARAAQRNKISRGCHHREDSKFTEISAYPPEDNLIKLSGGISG